MLKKNFIRLNVNDNYLSLGNVFRIIKEESINPNSFWQSDLFCIVFNTENIADSTVNNYCTGLRAINSKYKDYCSSLKNKYKKNDKALLPTIGKILMLINDNDDYENSVTMKKIDNDKRLKNICTRLYAISKNDSDVSNKLSKTLYEYLSTNDLYYFVCEVLFYTILDKKQPIYVNNSLNQFIEKSVYDTNISSSEIEQYIQIQLNSGIWSVRGIHELAKKNNSFACFEMASMEYFGIITGTPRYEKAYEYYKIAASNNHPVANWAIGYLYYKGYVGSNSKHDMYNAFKYFNKARKLKCSNSFNSLGQIILNGSFPHIKSNPTKALELFKTAASMGNVYAYNNLGKIAEQNKDYETAYNCYLQSSNLGESWAKNKLGEFYRLGKYVKKDLKKAFEYYTDSSDCAKFTLCPWSNYNLAKFYYMDGVPEIGINKDITKAIDLLSYIENNLPDACLELLYIYFKLYKSNSNDAYYDKVLYYKTMCEKHLSIDSTKKREIEQNLSKIKKQYTKIELP